MNKTFLNVVSLAKDPIIRKEEGGGGGATINNQEKSVDITENGVTEVTADAGFTGLSKVIVNTNVASSGGGGGSDMPVIGDGKTYFYITIASEGRMDVSLYFRQTVANGVTIDWGDGSAPETLSGTGYLNTTHKYAAIGDYVISLDPVDGCILEFGAGEGSPKSVLGVRSSGIKAYGNILTAVEIGKGVTRIGTDAFAYCSSLRSIVIPESVTAIKSSAFSYCSSLRSIVIPESVTELGRNAFASCYSLASIVIPESVTSISDAIFTSCSSLVFAAIPKTIKGITSNMFYNCTGIALIDFSSHTSVPSLSSTLSFYSIPSDCKIIVPDALYDTWIAATNWSTYASQIIKKSDWDASQS